ncbi:hypothetical protein [Clavibacter zhangzhiyongii]|uniref:hypothetical protein n=1 Tax=Clavibacter zhangzhiyongii TaxID=2768071 RepID=UPI0039E0EC36
MTDPRPAGDHPLGARPLSRRALLGGSAAAVGTALLAAPQAASASGPLLGAPDLGSPAASRALMRSAKGAYEFLDGRVDEYATGSQLRLPAATRAASSPRRPSTSCRRSRTTTRS